MGASHPTIDRQIRDIQYDACVLQSQANASQQAALKAQGDAREAQKHGLVDIAKTHARTSVIAQQHASAMFAMSARLTALVSKMQQVRATAKLAGSLTNLTRKLREMVRDTSNVEDVMKTFEASMADLDKVDALTGSGIDKLHGDIDVTPLMERVDDQVGLELVSAMPDVAVTVRDDVDIKSLEERYAQLA